MGYKLKNDEIKLKNIINDPDYEDSHTQLGERKEHLIKIIDEISELYTEYRDLKRESSKKSCSTVKRKKLRSKMKKDHEKMVELISSFKLEKGQLDKMVERLREVVIEIEDAEKTIADCMFKVGGKPISYIKKCLVKIPKTAKGN